MARETAKLPMEIFHTIDGMLSLGTEAAWGAGSYLFFSFPCVRILSSLGGQTFFQKFSKMLNFQVGD